MVIKGSSCEQWNCTALTFQMTALKYRAERLLEEAAFRLWIGASIAAGALLAVRFLLSPLPGITRLRSKVERSPE